MSTRQESWMYPMKFKSYLPLFALLCGVMTSSTAWADLRYAGSDTVEPVVDAARIAFLRGSPAFKLTLSSAGTGSGMRELCTARAFLVGASRPISADERQECAKAGVAPVEIPVGADAVVLVVSNKNSFVKELLLSEVKRIFAPASTGVVTSWKNVRDTFPDLRLRAVGVGIKHGTFEFFHTAIGNGKFVRSDYKDTVHHEETAKFVASDPGAVGYVPYSVAKDFASQLRMVSIDFGKGAVEPSVQAIADGSYSALSRMTYLYLNVPSLARSGSDAEAFVNELVGNLGKYVSFANMVPLSSLQYQESVRRLNQKK
jgi:phosphate transport system substrate-binding protein